MSSEIQTIFSETAGDVQSERLICRDCGHEHGHVCLAPGERALCVRCDSVLAKRGWLGADAALAFTVTGLLLLLPSILLPFVTVSKLGDERVGLLFTGVGALWGNGMHMLAVWVLCCGGVAPAFLLLSLAGLLIPQRLGWRPMKARRLVAVARAVAHWAVPDVQVLAVLVALAKLGNVVHVTLGPGFWCYVALAVTTMCAWRGRELELPV